jgi:hypothetical protein
MAVGARIYLAVAVVVVMRVPLVAQAATLKAAAVAVETRQERAALAVLAVWLAAAVVVARA